MLRNYLAASLLLLTLMVTPRASAQADIGYIAPYPGPAPASFASSQQYEQYAGWRHDVLYTRAEQLRVVGRPRAFGFKRLLALGAIAGGLTMVLLGLASVIEQDEAYDTEHGRDEAIIGAAVAGVGGGALAYLLSQNEHRDEVEALREESDYWLHEAVRVREERTSAISLRGARLTVTF